MAIAAARTLGKIVAVVSVLLFVSSYRSLPIDAASYEPDPAIDSTSSQPHSSAASDDTAINAYFLPFIHESSKLKNPHPSQNAIDQSPTIFLAWELEVDNPGDYRFHVYMDIENPNPTSLIASNLTAGFLDTATMAFGATYYWRVVATTASGQMVSGPTWSFTTMPPVPDPPDIYSTRVIPAGEFQMGCYPGISAWPCNLHEMPMHPVYLDSFEMSKYEVTNIQYRTCVVEGYCDRPRLASADGEGRSRYFSDEKFNYYPVVYVSWQNAQDYCAWQGMRLPTEAEWEKAARGVDMRSWPWGDEAPTCDLLNYLRASGDCGLPEQTRQVGSLAGNVSPYGLFDMAGNVKEWVNDLWEDGYYQRSPYYDPPGPEESYWHVTRGGCYREGWNYRMTTYRHSGHKGDDPLFRAPQGGFRCARSLNSSSESQ